MASTTATRMDALEIADFLEGQTTGVLSMADGDDGYGVPVAFAFDDEAHDFYFRLGYADDSQKRRFVEASDRVTLSVYDDAPGGSKSVLALGRLEELAASSDDAAAVEAARGLDIPSFSVHPAPPAETTFSVVRLDVTELSGTTEG